MSTIETENKVKNVTNLVYFIALGWFCWKG